MAGSLACTLREQVLAAAQGPTGDARFKFGTEYASNFLKPGDKAYESWKPLPLSHAQAETQAQGRHLISKSAIFPRLNSSLEEVRNKLLPVLNQFTEACKSHDASGGGCISREDLVAAAKAAGVHLTSADQDILLPLASAASCSTTNTAASGVPYHVLIDALLLAGNSGAQIGIAATQTTVSAASLPFYTRKALPTEISWCTDQAFTVTLQHRPTSQPYTFSAQQMRTFAHLATQICRQEANVEEVHVMLRCTLFQQLVVDSAPSVTGSSRAYADTSRGSFTQWLLQNSVMSVTLRSKPGPIPPEVYEVLDQVIYDGLGLPRVHSNVQTPTSLGASLRGASLLE